uniref:Resistance to inhibitors of cholinesterase protein 3 N-terminal domain-containing protein n=1 Tax=Neogobius melanostomus TaxID=47308 RepID=A0A8C6TZ09_9GOBI
MRNTDTNILPHAAPPPPPPPPPPLSAGGPAVTTPLDTPLEQTEHAQWPLLPSRCTCARARASVSLSLWTVPLRVSECPPLSPPPDMAVSGLQKLTVAAALVLCAALILPKLVLRRDTSEETGRGQFPPMMQRHVTPDLRGQRGHGEVRGTGSGGAGSGGGGAGTGSGLGGKSNLAAQIIPVYGFGILLYILYILFKITSKGHSKPSQSRLHSLRSESSKRKITDFELSQLQERLRETELVMENLVNNSLQEEEDIAVSVSLDQEQSLLQQLTEITRAMKSNHLQDFTNTTSPTEETESQDDFDSFWSHAAAPVHKPNEEEEHSG